MATMSSARKRAAIAFVAVGTGLIVQHTIASGGDADVVAPIVRESHAGRAQPALPAGPPETRQAAAASVSLRLDRLAHRTALPPSPGVAASGPPLFAVQSWQPPPAPPPPAAPAEPEAPPFPYSYMGGLSDDRGRTAFFNRGDRVLGVRAGETVDGNFRVDQLDETSMTVTYVPLNKTAQVPLGGTR